MNRDALEELISNATKTNAHPITPIALHGSLPWETTSASLSRIFYFPTTPLRLKQLSFQVENINIDNMKQWLFRDPEIKPLIPNADESFYMYNDQLLNFNVKHNYMTYNDSTSGENEESLSLSNQLDSIKNFVQRHQGWTGLYLLDEIQKDDLYLFRLFKQGYPVFWPNGDASHGIYPDLIQLQTGDNGVNKYTRSMYFLSGKPTELKEIVLPGKESLLTTLKQKGIPLNHVERIFPGYVAEETITNKRKQIQLNPVWVIHKTDGKKEFVN
jgi:regulatory protein YycH of two-component signal transduction system YycFG